MPMSRALVALLLFALAACSRGVAASSRIPSTTASFGPAPVGERPSEPAPPRVHYEPVFPSTRGEQRDECAVHEVGSLGELAPLVHVRTGERVGDREAIALLVSRRGALVLKERDEQTYDAYPIDGAHALGSPRQIELRGRPMRFAALSDGFLVFTLIALPSRRYEASWIGDDGTLRETVEIPLLGPTLDSMGRGPRGGVRFYFGPMPDRAEAVRVHDVWWEGDALRAASGSLPGQRSSVRARHDAVDLFGPEALGLWVAPDAPPELILEDRRVPLADSPIGAYRRSSPSDRRTAWGTEGGAIGLILDGEPRSYDPATGRLASLPPEQLPVTAAWDARRSSVVLRRHDAAGGTWPTEEAGFAVPHVVRASPTPDGYLLLSVTPSVGAPPVAHVTRLVCVAGEGAGG